MMKAKEEGITREDFLNFLQRWKWKGFWAGYGAAWAIHSLLQDMMGKAEYIRKCQDNWIDGGITVPLALIFIILAFRAMLKETIREER